MGRTLPALPRETTNPERVRAPRLLAYANPSFAVAGQVSISRLWHAVPCFPPISEIWLRLLEAYRG